MKDFTLNNNYKLEYHLGKSSYGVVICCTKLSDKSRVVCKGIHNDYKKYLIEKDILEELDHENIVKFYETFKTRDHHWMVIELIYGINLHSDLVMNGIYTDEKLNQVIIQLLKALEFIHSKNIVHRDIKGENILISRENNKIKASFIDFGTAVKLKKDNGIVPSTDQYSDDFVQPVFSMFYLSPEFPFKIGKHSDIWALGIVFHLISVGFYPFYKPSVREYMMDNENNELKIDANNNNDYKHLPGKVVSLLCSMLKNDYLERPNATMLLRDFQPTAGF